MQTKLGDSSIMISGVVGKDAETKKVGEKKATLTKFSVKVGDRMVGEEKQAIWVNCTAWNDMGKAASVLKKGDTVLAVGRIQKHIYNDKEYSELVCEFLTAVCRDTLPEVVSSDTSSVNDYDPDLSSSDLPF